MFILVFTNYLLPLFFNCLLYFALHIRYAGQKRVQFSVLNVCCRYLTCTMFYQPLKKKKRTMAMVYIEPNDCGITDEDSADDGDPGLVDNLTGNQFNAVPEAVFNNHFEGSETVSNEKLQTPRWVRDRLLPSTNEFFQNLTCHTET